MKKSDFQRVTMDETCYYFVTHEDTGTGRGLLKAYRVPKDGTMSIIKISVPYIREDHESKIEMVDVLKHRMVDLKRYLCDHDFIWNEAHTRRKCIICKLNSKT